MLDGNSQVVLGGSHPGNHSQAYSDSDLHLNLRPQQAFCSDAEGWGPLSPLGFHITPCFVDAIVAFVAIWGIFSGAAALYILLKKRIPQPVSKNWHFYAKLVCRSSPSFTRIETGIKL